jgi:hypothetical protein
MQQFIEELTIEAGIRGRWTKDITIYISASNPEPYCVGGDIHLPAPSVYDYDYGLFGRNFLHELSHAFDYVSNYNDDDMEDRANALMRSVSNKTIISISKKYRLPYA